ncbi:MAG TPA: hypothetical protein DCY74_07910 [Clostridiales bacterium]|jgi:hydrogenase nickel incorporation protein HypA/HybF|nr:hypothetical protein [Clostridiales bacterium]HCG35366.1 hypothetical protein [Clostridiales bacterium]
MHETALMENLIRIAEKAIKNHPVKQVTAIRLSVGKLANVMIDALEFAYDAYPKSDPFKGAKLIICETPILAKCETCGKEYPVKQFPFVCPVCQSRYYTILQGDDIYIESLDYET